MNFPVYVVARMPQCPQGALMAKRPDEKEPRFVLAMAAVDPEERNRITAASVMQETLCNVHSELSLVLDGIERYELEKDPADAAYFTPLRERLEVMIRAVENTNLCAELGIEKINELLKKGLA